MQQIALPRGVFPGCAATRASEKSPQGVRLKGWGPRGLSFKSGAREGGGELSYKWGGGGLLVRGVEPIKKRAEDKEKGKEAGISSRR